MNLLELPHDILRIIFSLLTRDDAVQLASTSRAAHTLAMPHVLYSVVLERPGDCGPAVAYPQLASFVSLILGNPGAYYAPLIRRLALAWDTLEPMAKIVEDYESQMSLLVNALQHAANVHTLQIWGTEATLHDCPALADVLAGYAALQHVGLRNVGPETESLLGRMASRPREIVLGDTRRTFAFDCLQPHTETLEVLRLSKYAVARPPSASNVWGALHTLDVTLSEAFAPLTWLARACPNVRFLSLRHMVPRLHLQTQSEPVAWAGLDVVTLIKVTPLQITSPVRVVRVGFTDQAAHRPSSALDFLRHAQPVVLCLQLSCAQQLLVNIMAGSEGFRQRLRYLQLSRWSKGYPSPRITHRFVSGNPIYGQRSTHSPYADPCNVFVGSLLYLFLMHIVPTTQVDFLQTLAGLHLSLVAIALYSGPEPGLECDTPASQECTAKTVAGLFRSVELVGFGTCDGSWGPILHYFSPTAWYRVNRARTVDGGLGPVVVEADHCPGETAAINEYVENLGHPR